MNPVNGEYVFGSPIVDKAVIRLENGKKFTIVAKNNSEKNKYIQSIKINGELFNGKAITYNQLMNGGKLELIMCENSFSNPSQ